MALFDKLKKEHDIAKAVKSNNAKVPIHLWDEGVVVVSRLDVYRTNVLMYHTMVLLAHPTKVRC